MHRVGVALFLVALSACTDIGPQTGHGGPTHLRLITSGLSKPLFLTAAPGDTAREFVVEQTGKIRIIRHDTLLANAFLDVTSQVGYDGQERGLLSVAFDPNYATNGHFFIDYTDVSGNIEIMRYTVSADPNVADAATADTVLEIDHSTYANHNGGLLLFGPDGFLYIGTGDGGSGGDPLHNGQDSTKLLGKILRIDVSSLPYQIPSSNPFASKPPAAPEVWAYGCGTRGAFHSTGRRTISSSAM